MVVVVVKEEEKEEEVEEGYIIRNSIYSRRGRSVYTSAIYPKGKRDYYRPYYWLWNGLN